MVRATQVPLEIYRAEQNRKRVWATMSVMLALVLTITLVSSKIQIDDLTRANDSLKAKVASITEVAR